MSKFLGSLRLAFFLIAILLAMVVISAVIPQKDIASGQIVSWQEMLGDKYIIIDRLGLDRIYYTPFFFIVLALLGINLLWGNVRRFRLISKSRGNLPRLRFLGSIVFHISLLVVIAGVILNYLHKYEGVFALTEGQLARDQSSDYFREFKGPLYGGIYKDFTIRLDKLRETQGEPGSDGEAAFTLFPAVAESLVSEISANHPFPWHDSEFHIGQQTGYSPEIHLMDKADSTIFRAFMRVAVTREQNRDVHRDFVHIPGEEWRLEVEVLPSPDPSEPARYSVALDRDSGRTQEALVNLGDTVDFGGAKLAIPRMRRWCYIGVVRSPYLSLVFFGFWAGLSGLALGFVSRLISTGGKS